MLLHTVSSHLLPELLLQLVQPILYRICTALWPGVGAGSRPQLPEDIQDTVLDLRMCEGG